MDEAKAKTVRAVLEIEIGDGDPDGFMERLAMAIGPFSLAIVQDFNAQTGEDITVSTIAQAARDD